MLIFRKIKFKNFLSSGNVPIEFTLDKHNVTTISGKNGAMKSGSIIDSVFFAMFGKTFRKLKKEQIVNSINKKNCVVELDFSNSGVEYKIIRGLSPNIFELYVNGVLKEQDASLFDYQTYIETACLKVNQKTMKQICFIGSSDFVPFMKLNKLERRNVVEELLDIQIFSIMNGVLKTKVSLFSTTLNELDYKISSVQDKIFMYEKQIEEMKEQYDEIKTGNNKQIMLSENEITKLSATIETELKEIQQLLESVTDSSNVRSTDAEINGIITMLNQTKNKHEKEKSFFVNNSDCPTCTQSIEEAFRNKSISSHENKITKFDDGLAQALSKKEALLSRIKEIDDIQKEIYEKEQNVNHSTLKINTLKESIDVFTRANNDLEKKSVVSDVEFYDGLLKEQKNNEEKKQKIKESVHYHQIIHELLKDSGIKTAIIKNYISTINSLIKKYMEIMGFNCEFSFDYEFNETMKSRHRDKFGYSNFSSGEQLRIDLSILFAFRELAALKNSAATNLLILDEIHGSSLDEEGKEAFLKIVDEASKSSNVFLISHDPSIDEADFIDRRITFEKENNFSKMKSA